MPSNISVSGRSFFTIEPRRAALIIIDMQNAFVAEGAPLETPPAREMIPRLERLIRFAASAGCRSFGPNRITVLLMAA